MVEYWVIFEQPGMELPNPSIIWLFTHFNLTTQVDFDVFSLYSVNITYFMCFSCTVLNPCTTVFKVIHLSRTQCYLVSDLQEGQRTIMLSTH
jgi:hypothetical protein